MNPPDKAPMKRVLVCLGDSITYGFPYGPQSSWVNALHGKIAAIPLNRGVNGDTTADMLRRLPGELTDSAASHVHILGGINDAWVESDPAYSRQCMEQMVQMCTGRGVTPILGLITPVCTKPTGGNNFFPFGPDGIVNRLARYREWLRNYTAANSIPLIDYFTPLCRSGTEEGDPSYFIDAVHLSRQGNMIITRVAARKLAKFLLDK